MAIKIVIFYKEQRWADALFDKLIAEMSEDRIQRFSKMRNNSYIQLNDGSSIVIHKANKHSRTMRCDTAMAQEGINENFIKLNILPIVDRPPILVFDKDYKYKTYII